MKNDGNSMPKSDATWKDSSSTTYSNFGTSSGTYDSWTIGITDSSVDTSIILRSQEGKIVELYIDSKDGLLKCKGDIDEDTIRPFMKMFNQTILEDANIPVKLELMLIDAVKILSKSDAAKTSQGKKLLRQFKNYMIGEDDG